MLDFTQGGFDAHDIELIRKGLNRMPRRVSTAHSKRAGVVLPLCNVDGVPCILFEKRSHHLRAHPDEVGDYATIIRCTIVSNKGRLTQYYVF